MLKRYQCRKNSRRFRKGMSVLLALMLVVNGAMMPGITSEATQETTQATSNDNDVTDASVSKARQDAEEAKKNKKEAQEVIDKLKGVKENIEDYIVNLDKNLNELQIEIAHLEKDQKELEERISKTEKELEEARRAWTTQYAEMKQRIQMVYESGNKRYLDILLTATSMTDMLNKSEYASQVSAYDYSVLTQLRLAKEKIGNLKLKLERDMASNESLQKQVKKQKKTMEQLVEEKTKQVNEYKNAIAVKEDEVAKYNAAIAEAESIIAAAELAASTSSTSTYSGGVFTWPAPGNYEISSQFGSRTSPVAGASSNHRGIDIKCSTGDPIVAASSGTVIVATYNYAEGNYVCIDHGGGVVTVYMHNSQLNVSVGEHVSAGQTIALAGSTGISTGPHCHFGVRVDGNYVDPMGYLR
ncbi:MAG: peptidoglycan DD-metalloendopeptidase family protein [Eubacteriales bacterium]|nr:peptidoglycan DD-metalloendopeptidase family protein [Eubacteriales bacterium]